MLRRATSKILRDEAAPAPLVFHFIKNILAIASIAIQLAETHKLSAAPVSHSTCTGPLTRPGNRIDAALQRRRLSAVQPIFEAIDAIAAHCEAWSPW
ncbi:MAG: hypothetical protein ACLP4V_17755 [Methylocella sp.]